MGVGRAGQDSKRLQASCSIPLILKTRQRVKAYYVLLQPFLRVRQTLSGNSLKEECQYQLDLFNDISKEVNVEKIEKSMDEIRARFGKESIVRASLMKKEAGPMPRVAFKACFNHIVDHR